jgi:diamine N-acetyltransferase
VGLGPIRRDLIPLYMKWINDFEVTRGLLINPPMTLEQEEAWYERASKAEGHVLFGVFELPSMRPIGNVGLHDIDHFNRTAEFGIVIGEKDCWNKGYGTEATTLMLDYGFTALGLHNIILQVYGYNEYAHRAYLRAGFREMGRRREAKRMAGRAYDIIYMDCLAADFKSPVLGRILDDRR